MDSPTLCLKHSYLADPSCEDCRKELAQQSKVVKKYQEMLEAGELDLTPILFDGE